MNVKLFAPELLDRRVVASSGGVPRGLAAVLEELRESDIAVEASIGATIDLWIGEEDTGSTAYASFALVDARRATRWLHRTAIRLFPASAYAWKHAIRYSPIVLLAALWRPF